MIRIPIEIQGSARNWATQVVTDLDALQQRLASIESRVALKSDIPPPYSPQFPQPIFAAISANTVLQQSELCKTLIFNCTSACSLTLPTPFEGAWSNVFNCGTQTLTLKDDLGNTMATLTTNTGTNRFDTVQNSSAVALWPTVLPIVVSPSGVLTLVSPLSPASGGLGVATLGTAGNLPFTNNAAGVTMNPILATLPFSVLIDATNGQTTGSIAPGRLYLKDAQGTPHYWQLTVSNTGVLTTTDAGTTAPVNAFIITP